jgi:selenocysteine-specific elongation factor
MPIVATAGHVDHGKSTLVEALTGRDPDRWAEEKARGLTIDLGFAWTEIGGIEVGFVDVPGHERFIKNMLAGVGAVDVALFVVAADEGWMPQSEEHLGILDLLDTRYGVIALTRVDLADAEAADLAELSVLEATEGTALSAWPIVRVSPVTGAGMDELRLSLVEQLIAAGEPVDADQPRLWVDRAFTISGAGLVVTGTLSGGTIAMGDEVMMWPAGVPVRIRGLQRHDTPVNSLSPGTRAALNITGIAGAARGAMLGKPGSFGTTTRFLGRLRTVRTLEEDLSSRGAFHLHVGSGSWPVRLRIIESASGLVCLIRTESPVPLRCGDRFILRETGRRAVVGGGVVLDPHPPESGDQLRIAIGLLVKAVASGPDEIAAALLTIRGTATVEELVRDAGGRSIASEFRAGNVVMAAATAAGLRDAMTEAVRTFHGNNRLRPGIPKASLGSTLGVDGDTVAMVVAGTPELIDDGPTVRLASFEPGLSRQEQKAWDVAEAALGAGPAVPRASQLGLDTELLHALIRDDRLIKIGEDLVYLPQQIEAIKDSLQGLGHGFTVAEFRDHIGVTRRQAIPLLEWFDNNGVTIRRGDIRELKNQDKPIG